MSEEEAVQVAVRMRIFNQREKDAASKRVIRMTREEVGSKTFITNPETDEEKEFKFDFSFNSHDPDPKVGPYATQDDVFEQLGRPVLSNALEGKNVCLFAYGQTGAGKSFSMLGKNDPPEMRGIIPRTCHEIFRVRDNPTDEDKKNDVLHEVTIEVIEIYCENCNDLLCERKKWPPKGHTPRPHPKGGFACTDVIKQYCQKYADIEEAFQRADRNRSVGSHALNPESSRAHTIYKITYVKTTTFKDLPEGRNKQTLTAQINLVDLAGSERTEAAGTSGQMLKEGNAINLSLTSLGNTIKALTTPNEKPQFRNSKLTMLLMQSMTSGKVIMIAAVSPAAICYDESVSTLRFAERIKQVKIRVAKNVTIDPVAEMRKQMEEMRERMQAEIDELRSKGGSGDPGAMDELKKALDEQLEAERHLREEAQRQIAELQESKEQREARVNQIMAEQKKGWEGVFLGDPKNLKVPHLLNLNEDSRLAETLVYPIDKPVVTCGRADPSSPPTLEFNGMGIIKGHCIFEYDAKANKVLLKPGNGARCSVNGKSVTEPLELRHNNRVWLGNNYAFRLAIPGKEKDGDTMPNGENPDYAMAEAELEVADDKSGGGKKGDEKDAYLRRQLNEALKKIEQANIIAADLESDAVFSPKIIKNRDTKEDQVVVSVQLPQGQLTWPWERFTTRLVDMVKLWQHWQFCSAYGQTFKMPEDDENPFVDNGHQLVGEADVLLSSLSNMIENPVDPPVLSVTGVQEGRLKVCIAPLDRNGGEGPWDDDDLDPFVGEAEEIKDKEIGFVIHVESLVFDVDVKAGGRPKYRDVFVRFRFNAHDPDDLFVETPCDTSGNMDIKFNFKKKYKVKVDEDMFQHILKGKMTFQVWGKPADAQAGGAAARSVHQLPEGWKKVTAYMSPDGKLQLNPPE